MSTSFNQGKAQSQNEKVPEWLQPFLQNSFFGSCSDHEQVKNEMNRYCITCDLAACRYCISSGSHDEHKVLKIYRHVYQDVVPVDEMKTHIDCSQIQPYKCNKKWIIALNPLPHCGSGAQIDEDLSCVVCKRKLMDPGQFRYCCIACQVQAFSRKRKEPEQAFLPCEGSSVGFIRAGFAAGESRKRQRKGVPIRAPLF